MLPTLTKLLCIALGVALGSLWGVGFGCEVRRWLKSRKQASKSGAEALGRVGH